MHPEDIKAALRKRGLTQAQIARNLNVSKTSVCYVIDGRASSRRVAEAIAQAVGLPMGTLWPKRYS